jgi:hypothetical protein
MQGYNPLSGCRNHSALRGETGYFLISLKSPDPTAPLLLLLPLQAPLEAKDTRFGSPGLGIRLDLFFLWLLCSLLLLPPLTHYLAQLPTISLFSLGTWSQLLPKLSLSSWPAGVTEVLTLL